MKNIEKAVPALASVIIAMLVMSCTHQSSGTIGEHLSFSSQYEANEYYEARSQIGNRYWARWSEVRVCDSPDEIVCPQPDATRSQKSFGPFTVKDVIHEPYNTVPIYWVEMPDGKTKYLSMLYGSKLLTVDPKITAAKADAACKRKGGVHIGMTAEEVLASCWGKPNRRNVTRLPSGTDEQWVYGGAYVYFRDGVVSASKQPNKAVFLAGR